MLKTKPDRDCDLRHLGLMSEDGFILVLLPGWAGVMDWGVSGGGVSEAGSGDIESSTRDTQTHTQKEVHVEHLLN